MIKRALFSLHLLDKVVEFSKSLSKLGWEIIASRETSDILLKNNIPVVEISDFTGIKEDYGFPPTLHPKIEAYITKDQHQRIDLVYVIPYPLSIGNDVGGRTLLALAAKGNRIPVTSVLDMELVINELRSKGKISQELHQMLLNKTNALIATHYDDLLTERKAYDLIIGSFQRNLINGENPYQVPADLFSAKINDPLAIHNFRQLSGDPPCFTNVADSDCIVQTMCLAAEVFKLRYKKIPYICIAAKHGNPCGMAVSWDDRFYAVDRALFGNPQAIWGGEVVVNFNIDEAVANKLYKSKERKEKFGDASWMLDVIIAPGFTPEAVKILGQRKNRKIFENKALFSPFLPLYKYTYRFVRGGFLRQPPHNFILDFNKTIRIGPELKDRTIDSLIIAWSVAWSSYHAGNEVAIAKDLQLLGVGGGPSTVEAVSIATMRSQNYGHNLKDAVFAADAFFPFTDAPKILAGFDLQAGIVPLGGKLIDLVQRFFEGKGLSIVYLPEEYRGFCRH